VNKIAAVVNGEMITMHELRMHTAAELGRRRIPLKDPKVPEVEHEVLESMIIDILMRQEAKRFKVTVTDAELEEDINRTVQQSGMSRQDFEARLKSQGITMDMYKERMSNNALRQRMANFMVARKVFVTPEEVEAYYETHKSKMVSEETADFSLLLLPENVNVQDLYKKIQNGSLSFEDVARQYSADGSAKDGGRIVGVPWERMLPQMKNVLTALKDGQMTPIMRTRGGYVIIRRDALHTPRPLTFAEAKPKIEDIIRAPRLEERFKEYTSQLRSKAVIDIRF
jgi:Parvulin-like peptidyl-prolyl isomerase